MKKNLQYNNDELNEKIIRLNNEINNKDMEQKSLLKAMNKMQKEKKEFEKTNSKYHSVIYGRFKKKEGNKDY
jgi:cell division septum initiation protein DivIVA